MARSILRLIDRSLFISVIFKRWYAKQFVLWFMGFDTFNCHAFACRASACEFFRCLAPMHLFSTHLTETPVKMHCACSELRPLYWSIQTQTSSCRQSRR